MFVVGDKVVYPMHGAGTIISIEEKEVLGTVKKYLIMKMPIGNIRLSIPVDKVDAIGVREIINKEDEHELIEVLEGKRSEMPINWNQRYRENLERLKSGKALEIACVVRNLTLLDAEKGLSTGEKKMLSSAKKMIVSELILVSEREEEEVEILIDRAILD